MSSLPSDERATAVEVEAFLESFILAMTDRGPLPKLPPELRARLGEDGLAEMERRLQSIREVNRQLGIDRGTERGNASRIGKVRGKKTRSRANQAKRVRLIKEIDGGGMGVVYTARDRHLRRNVAVKVLRNEYLDNSDVVRRFQEEARIGGRLEHPSIVPVYDMGRFPDGRPFFVMKFVVGENLAALLERRIDPSEKLWDWLKVFEQVCQSVAYAHSRGIVHRDLKPANVKVGEFNEVQVMDWGLAKVLRGGRESEVARTVPDGAGRASVDGVGSPVNGHTGHGTLLGTLPYMAPEQARGENHLVDERADVFALGSILCEILTGKPAYTGATPDEVRAKAIRCELTEALARLTARRQLEPELVALASSCLESDLEKRPRDAAVVAAAMKVYRVAMEERDRDAKIDKVERAAKARHQRLRRRLGSVIVLVILAAAVFISAAAWWAAKEAKLAGDSARLTSETLSDVVVRIASDERLDHRGLADVREKLLVPVLPRLEAFFRLQGRAGGDRLQGRALVSLAEVYRVQAKGEEALEALADAESHFTAIVNARRQMPDPESIYGLAVARMWHGVILGRSRDRADEAMTLLNDAADHFSDLLAEGRGDSLDLRRRLALCRNLQGNCLRFRDPAGAVTAYHKALDEFQAVADADPSDGASRTWLVKTRSNLGLVLERVGRWAEALAVHRETRDLAKQHVDRALRARTDFEDLERDTWLLFDLDHREAYGVALNNLGELLTRMGRPADAEAVFLSALDTYRSLADAVPSFQEYPWGMAMTDTNLGQVLTTKGPHGWAQAEERFRKARTWFASEAKRHPNDKELGLYLGVNLLHEAEFELTRWAAGYGAADRAVAAAEEACAVLERAGDGPETVQSLSEARILLGDCIDRSGNHATAEAAWTQAHSILTVLAADWPRVPRFTLLLARTHVRLGKSLASVGRRQEAAFHWTEADRRLDAARAAGSDDPLLGAVSAEFETARGPR